MIRSMTGFGDASTQADGIHYSVELRSLNNKYFKCTVRLPDQLQGLEAELEAQLRKRVSRGSFTLTVKFKTSDAQAVSKVNDEAILTYLDHLETIHAKIQDRAVQIDLTQLLALPGVLQPAEDEASLLAKARPVVARLLDEAIEKLLAMRAKEGQALAADLSQHLELILDRMKQIADRAPAVIEEYHQRLRARMDELLSRAELKADEQLLIREVAVFAERADISEEVSRMAGHVAQFQEIIASKDNGEPVGRTLDFLAQEMLREANTIGSKSNDAQISRAMIEAKSAVDRIKEQVQNVE
ncbi:MAG: YicC family protein [Phycisphaeraceae bacterium]